MAVLESARPTTSPETTVPWLAEHERFLRELPADEPAPVKALRRLGIERFAALGFPTLRQEDWRFTNVAPIARGTFVRPQTDPDAADPARLAVLEFPEAARLVFVDGRFSAKLSHVDEVPAGTVVTSLAEALERTPDQVLPWLGQLAQVGNHPFVALNTAFLRDGAFVLVPRGAVVEKPIHLLFLSSGETGSATFSFPRNLIVAGENSHVTVVETYTGDGVYLCSPVTELAAGPASVIDHYK